MLQNLFWYKKTWVLSNCQIRQVYTTYFSHLTILLSFSQIDLTAISLKPQHAPLLGTLHSLSSPWDLFLQYPYHSLPHFPPSHLIRESRWPHNEQHPHDSLYIPTCFDFIYSIYHPVTYYKIAFFVFQSISSTLT